jgi:pyrroline-5-carboxylate reductase
MIAIGFLGAGNMAEAIIGGIIKKGLYHPSGI